MAHLFICPNCGRRTTETERNAGFRRQAKGCANCGFGFLFELLDDYYPAPNAGLVACDQEGRVLASGRGVFELSGYREHELMGKSVVDAFGLADFESERDPFALAREWGVRRLGERLTLRTRAGSVKPMIADVFPAYDDDGGLLVALTPR